MSVALRLWRVLHSMPHGPDGCYLVSDALAAGILFTPRCGQTTHATSSPLRAMRIRRRSDGMRPLPPMWHALACFRRAWPPYADMIGTTWQYALQYTHMHKSLYLTYRHAQDTFMITEACPDIGLAAFLLAVVAARARLGYARALGETPRERRGAIERQRDRRVALIAVLAYALRPWPALCALGLWRGAYPELVQLILIVACAFLATFGRKAGKEPPKDLNKSAYFMVCLRRSNFDVWARAVLKKS